MSDYDCLACGACCREAFDSTPVDDDEVAVLEAASPTLIVEHADGWRDLRRVPSPLGCGSRCAALADGPPFTCSVYEARPSACRDLEPGGDACVLARRRVGLEPWPEGVTPDGPLFADR